MPRAKQTAKKPVNKKRRQKSNPKSGNKRKSQPQTGSKRKRKPQSNSKSTPKSDNKRKRQICNREGDIHVIFCKTKITNYFKCKTKSNTFMGIMERENSTRIMEALTKINWEFNGNDSELKKILKAGLGGRLYSRNILKMWESEKLLRFVK